MNNPLIRFMGWIFNSASTQKPCMRNSWPPSSSSFIQTAAAKLVYRMIHFFPLLSLPSLLCIAGGQKFVFTLSLMEKHCSGTQILKYTHRHIIASAVNVLVCVYFQGLRWYLLKNARVREYSRTVIDSCWHCTDRSACLCENRPPRPPHKSHFHVSLNLLKLHVLGEWANEATAPVLEKYVVGAHFHYRIPFGPLWLNCLSPAMFVCVLVFEHNCISVCPQPNLASVWCCSYGSLCVERQCWAKHQNS